MLEPSPLDQRQQVDRLRVFLRLLMPVAASFGALELWAGVTFGDPQSLGAGVTIWLYLGVTVLAFRLLLDGRLTDSAILTSVGAILTAMVIAAIQPALYPGLLGVAPFAVAVALPYLHGRTLILSLAVSWLGAIAIVTLGLLRPTPTILPDLYVALFNVAGVAAATGLVLLLLWQFGNHLTGAVLLARRATEELRLAAAERLAASQRLAILERHESLAILAGGIAHDFNNLLTAILGHAELLKSDLPSTTPPEARESLAAIDTAARRAAVLSRQMLAYSGRSAVVLQQTDPGEIVAGLRAGLRETLPDQVRLEVSMDGAPGRIAVDSGQLRQAIRNAVDNAVQAMAEASTDRVAAGTITLHVREVEIRADDPPAPIAPDPVTPGRYVAFEISDDGPGIPRSLGVRIFEPFVTTGFAGRGLGLPVVLGVVRSHGGAVTVAPASGGGTIVTLLIPFADR